MLTAIASDLDRNAPALPSLSDDSKANLFPFAAMCAGFIAPLLRFWVHVLARGIAAFGNTEAFLIAAGIIGSIAMWWLPPSWYRTRSFERGQLYPGLGVVLFRRIVPNGDWVNAWRRRHSRTFRVIANRAEVAELYRRTLTGEKSHLVLLGIASVSAAYAYEIGWKGWATYIGVANVFANLYPIMLQRYTRTRIVRRRSASGS